MKARNVYSNQTDEKATIKIGVDIGGTAIKLGLVNAQNEIICKESTPTEAALGVERVIDNLLSATQRMLEKCDITYTDCIGMGIGCPGTIDPEKGIVEYSNNIDWENVELVKEIEKRISIPVRIENDANCAVLGEMVAGKAKGYDDVVLITIGTGIGSGIICDGKIFHGGANGGGEAGHTVICVGGEQCTCGRKGCLEAYVSATALIRDAVRAAERHPDSLLNTLCENKLANMNAEIPFTACKNGDAVAKELIEHYFTYFGEFLTDIVNIFRPDVVLIGGGVSEQGDYLIAPLQEYVEKYAFGGRHIFIPKILKAELGNQAGLIGAANLF